MRENFLEYKRISKSIDNLMYVEHNKIKCINDSIGRYKIKFDEERARCLTYKLKFTIENIKDILNSKDKEITPYKY